MKLKMCGCRSCKRHRKSGFNQSIIKAGKHSCRSKARQMLKKGEYDDLPGKVYLPYF